MLQTSSSVLPDTKPHYEILDGLRGVAALLVLFYHVFDVSPSNPVFHGYLAVDFFFILSGFVIGYAYDDRLKKQMTVKDFLKRRIIRLHPMVVAGVIIGALSFIIQGSVSWNGTHIATSLVMLAMLLNLFMIPEWPGAPGEVRGIYHEMFPLNGPHWSLFFEYIGNIVYALFIRRFSTKVLTVLVVLLGIALAVFAIDNGNLSVGWTMAGNHFYGGFIRMMFPYTAGMLLSRVFKPVNIKGDFWIFSFLITAFLFVPRLGNENTMWLNGLFDTICVIIVFPVILILGASAKTTGAYSTGICKFLGDISYPIYAVHYPVMCLYFSYIGFPNILRPFSETWPVAIAIYFGCILLAYLCLKFYDEPVRRYLTKRFLRKP